MSLKRTTAGPRDLIAPVQEAPITVLSAVQPSRAAPVLRSGRGTAITSITSTSPTGVVAPSLVTGGVDTHGRTHHAAVLDALGRQLGDREFATTPAGYASLRRWLVSHGDLNRVGVEGTGSYGAALTRYLAGQGVDVVEVDRPDRKDRRNRGKSDPLDAYSAARAVLSGAATGEPKARDGRVESIRALRVARAGAMKARTQAMNQLKSLLTTAPAELREQLRALAGTSLVRAAVRLRPGSDLDDPLQATKTALRRIARRHEHLSLEISEADDELRALTADAAPRLLELHGVGPEVAAQLLITAGDNPSRLRSESAFAHLCGVAPVPASSGRIHRHRLNRAGDRQANKALYTVVVVRLRWDERTREYARRRTAEGLSKPEIIRCLKRYVAREVFTALKPQRPEAVLTTVDSP